MIERLNFISGFALAPWRASLLPFMLAGMLGTACQAATAPPVERLGFAPSASASLPLDERFADEYGRHVRLGDYLQGRPALIVPAWYGCSNLCSVVLGSLAASLSSSGLRAGRELEVVVVSISPLDTPAEALSKKRAIFGERSTHVGGWHFLTGSDPAIREITSALGYRYAYEAAEQQYAHPAGVAVAAPGGRIRRVLYGATFPADELRKALATATEAEVDTTNDRGAVRDWLLCFHYDPASGRYSFAAMSAVRAAALLALLALGGYVARSRWRERRMLHGCDRHGLP